MRWTPEQLEEATGRISARVERATRHHEPLCRLLEAHHLPRPVAEIRFHPVRQWRIDIGWPDVLLGIEIEGGLWSKDARARSAHARPLGIMRDMEKGNAAVECGWAILRYTPEQLTQAETIRQIGAVWRARRGS